MYICHLTSHTPHLSSHEPHCTSVISRATIYICHLTSHIVHLSSHEPHPTSVISRATLYICHLTSHFVHLSSHEPHSISVISRATPHIGHFSPHSLNIQNSKEKLTDDQLGILNDSCVSLCGGYSNSLSTQWKHAQAILLRSSDYMIYDQWLYETTESDMPLLLREVRTKLRTKAATSPFVSTARLKPTLHDRRSMVISPGVVCNSN